MIKTNQVEKNRTLFWSHFTSGTFLWHLPIRSDEVVEAPKLSPGDGTKYKEIQDTKHHRHSHKVRKGRQRKLKKQNGGFS